MDYPLLTSFSSTNRSLFLFLFLFLFVLLNTCLLLPNPGVAVAEDESSAVISRFQQYLQIDTAQPSPRYQEAADFLISQAKSIGLESQIIEFAVGKPLVLLKWAGSDPTLPSILLYSHTDVVPVEQHKWAYPAFSAQLDSHGNIYARGAQDMKCVGMQYLEAVRRLKSSGFQPVRSIYLCFAPDEEINGHDGAEKFADSDIFKTINVGIVLDEGLASPTEKYRAFYAERSPWWLAIKATGSPGHGSRLYDNSAMENLLKSIESVRRFRASQFDLVKSGLKEANYRTLGQLFETAKERSETFAYSLSVSVLEVYNEQIRDLLATSPTSKKLEIKQSSEGSHHVPGIVEAKVDNLKEVWNVLQAGSNARSVGSNNVNEHSSRSHCMLCVMVKAKNLMNGECTKSKLWLVDLAGSERLAKTEVQGERLKEAQNINRSLSAIGDVIYALATKSSHIPYRNSKLTHLLQDSLGGDSKTLMFVQISPSEQDLSETLSSLNFATRVRGIELGPAKKQIDTSELQRMKLMLDKARQESKAKDESLRKIEENLQNMENKARSKDHIYKVQQEKIKELEGQLEQKSNLNSQSEKQVLQLSDKLKGREEICNALQQKVKELENKLRERQQSDSAAFQQKVKELENKLKEQVQESEFHSLTLQNKVKELERKLMEQEQSSETLLLQQKIKELEEKLREQEKQLQWMQNQDISGMIRATPSAGKIRTRDDEVMSEIECHVLRSSNSINHPLSHGSAQSKGNDSLLHETRKNRQYRSGEIENIIHRKSDPPRIARVMRTAKPVTAAVAAPGPLTHKRISRDQGPGIKERDAKKKIWSR